MFKVQGKEIKNVAERVVSIVRTYKGDIKRANTGRVTGYPLSFITVGISITVTDDKTEIRKLQQLLLSADKLSIQCDHNGVDFLGEFSVTSQAVEELRDRAETKSTIKIELVSHGTPIKKPNGANFVVTYGTSTMSASFGEVVTVPSGYKLDGATLPENKLLVLGDVTLTTG